MGPPSGRGGSSGWPFRRFGRRGPAPHGPRWGEALELPLAPAGQDEHGAEQHGDHDATEQHADPRLEREVHERLSVVEAVDHDVRHPDEEARGEQHADQSDQGSEHPEPAGPASAELLDRPVHPAGHVDQRERQEQQPERLQQWLLRESAPHVALHQRVGCAGRRTRCHLRRPPGCSRPDPARRAGPRTANPPRRGREVQSPRASVDHETPAVARPVKARRSARQIGSCAPMTSSSDSNRTSTTRMTRRRIRPRTSRNASERQLAKITPAADHRAGHRLPRGPAAGGVRAAGRRRRSATRPRRSGRTRSSTYLTISTVRRRRRGEGDEGVLRRRRP